MRSYRITLKLTLTERMYFAKMALNKANEIKMKIARGNYSSSLKLDEKRWLEISDQFRSVDS